MTYKRPSSLHARGMQVWKHCHISRAMASMRAYALCHPLPSIFIYGSDRHSLATATSRPFAAARRFALCTSAILREWMSWRSIATCDSLRCNTTACHGSWKTCTYRCMHTVVCVAWCKQAYSHASPSCVGVVIQRKYFSAQQMPKHTKAYHPR
jgi:hypothetical protein